MIFSASNEQYKTGGHWGACNLKFGSCRRCATPTTSKFEVADTQEAAREMNAEKKDSTLAMRFEVFDFEIFGILDRLSLIHI